jgi:hypothetical protein
MFRESEPRKVVRLCKVCAQLLQATTFLCAHGGSDSRPLNGHHYLHMSNTSAYAGFFFLKTDRRVARKELRAYLLLVFSICQRQSGTSIFYIQSF